MRAAALWFRLGYLLLVVTLHHTRAAEFYVSPEGLRNGTGSITQPWTLAAALAHPPAVQPGDTIWLRGGAYAGSFVSNLRGSAGAPIIVRQFPGETAILTTFDARPGSILRVNGSFSSFWGFTISNNNPARVFITPQAGPPVRANSVDVYGAHTKLINLIIHDTAQGPGLWSQAGDTEMYGCIVYNNGWLGKDRGHGHGVYMQNESGVKLLRDNILFNQFGLALQAYGSAAAPLRGFVFEGNIVFNGRFLVGGANPAQDVVFRENLFYRSPAEFGYDNKANTGIVIENNYLTQGLNLKWWRNARISGNTLYDLRHDGQSRTVLLMLTPNGKIADFRVDGNRYFQSHSDTHDFGVHFPDGGVTFDFSGWREKLGYDRGGAYVKTGERLRPSGAAVFVRKNLYEPGRGHIAIFNWDLSDSVSVDVSEVGLRSGDTYELRNVQSLEKDTLTAVAHGTLISIPMTGWHVEKPIGYDKTLGDPTFPEFGAFLIQKVDLQQPLTISLPRVSWLFSRSVTVQWLTNRPASTEIQYGLSEAYDQSFRLEEEPKKNHTIAIRNLQPSSTYHYRLKSVDAAGKIAYSADATVTTAAH